MRRGLAVAASVVLLLAACFAALAATLVYVFNCDDPTALDCARKGLARAQFALGFAGLVPAGLLVFGTVTRRVWVALPALTAGLLVYTAWGLLVDATLNGWGHLMFF